MLKRYKKKETTRRITLQHAGRKKVGIKKEDKAWLQHSEKLMKPVFCLREITLATEEQL